MYDDNRTWGSRYDELGISGYIRQHAARQAGDLAVFDVGCSRGTALAECKEALRSAGVEIRAVGIDPSYTVAAEAESNLDEFICKDVVDVDRAGEADVVICANVINLSRRIGRSTRGGAGEIFWHAAGLLKPGGIIIANAHGVPPGCMEGLRRRDDFVRERLRPGFGLGSLVGSLRGMQVYEKVEPVPRA